jgi:hypothetical protein
VHITLTLHLRSLCAQHDRLRALPLRRERGQPPHAAATPDHRGPVPRYVATVAFTDFLAIATIITTITIIVVITIVTLAFFLSRC